jgi:DNA polymerase I
MNNQKKRQIFLIDGHSLCYRAFYAIKELTSSKGMPTNAIYGVVNMLNRLINDHHPDMLAVAFDVKGPTKRHKKFKEYKIQRKPMPEDLVVQMPRIKEVLAAYNIPLYEMEGIEADDVIATLAVKSSESDLDVVIVTSDKDALQLVDDSVKILSPNMKEDKFYDAGEVKKKFGVEPGSMVELMSLTGDTSDNVPGVRGVGIVTAQKLINEYGDIDNLYKNLESVSSLSLRKKLEDNKEAAFLSRELIILEKDLSLQIDQDALELSEPNRQKLSELYKEFEFNKLLREVMPLEEKETDYGMLSGEKQIRPFLQDLVKMESIACLIDRDKDNEKIKGMAFSDKSGRARYVSMKDISFEEVCDSLFVSGATIVTHDYKKEVRDIRKLQGDREFSVFDIMIADYLLDPSVSDHSLEDIAIRHLSHNMRKKTDKMVWDDSGQGELDFSENINYMRSCEEADMIFRAYPILKSAIEELELKELFSGIEMPLVSVLADMEAIGIGIDLDYVEKMSVVLTKRLEKSRKVIFDLAGEEFNINSPKQLQQILFHKLNMPVLKKTKTGISTDETVLNKLAEDYELPEQILGYRSMNKLKTTYYDSLKVLTDKSTGRVHTHYNQAVTSTGRLSSSEPNLQNIPIRTEMGREIRKAFIAGERGRILLCADYSQIELRILAHLSKDSNLIEAFCSGEDIHRFTASLIYDVCIDDVTYEMRSAAKTINFGIVYGMSAFRLANDLGISVEEARDFIDAYFKRYPGVKDFMETTISQSRKTGYVTTLLNRRRYIPEINATNAQVRGFAERAAINTPVQGSAADLIKLAMLECSRGLDINDIDMVLQVHDELIFTVHEGNAEKYAGQVRSIMEGVMDLDVPLVVDIETGKNWMELKEITVTNSG